MTRVFPSYFGTPGYESRVFRDWPLPKYFEENLGVEWTTPEQAEEVWLFDFSWSGLKHALKFPKSHRKLFVYEPQAVNPVQHTQKIQSLFGQVFVFSRAQIKPTNTFIEGEGFRGVGEKRSSHPGSKRIGAAFGNKQSVVPGSLYWLRVDSMRELLIQGYEVTLAGPGWEDSPSKFLRQVARTLVDCFLSLRLPDLGLLRPMPLQQLRRFENFNYKGWVDDEVSFFRDFDAVLIIENDIRFLSEKPFGAIASGTPFIYVGPSELEAYVRTGPDFKKHSNGLSVVRSVLECDFVMPSVTANMENLQRRNASSFFQRLAEATVLFSSGNLMSRRNSDHRGE